MGSKPSPPSPKIIMQKPTAPTVYRTIVPEESYQDAANYLARLNSQLADARAIQERQVGTSADIGMRQRGVEMQEAADIKSSMPGGPGADPGFMGVALNAQGGVNAAATAKMSPPGVDKYKDAREVAQIRLDAAKAAYKKAPGTDYSKENANQALPSWAKNQKDVFNPPEKK